MSDNRRPGRARGRAGDDAQGKWGKGPPGFGDRGRGGRGGRGDSGGRGGSGGRGDSGGRGGSGGRGDSGGRGGSRGRGDSGGRGGSGGRGDSGGRGGLGGRGDSGGRGGPPPGIAEPPRGAWGTGQPASAAPTGAWGAGRPAQAAPTGAWGRAGGRSAPQQTPRTPGTQGQAATSTTQQSRAHYRGVDRSSSQTTHQGAVAAVTASMGAVRVDDNGGNGNGNGNGSHGTSGEGQSARAVGRGVARGRREIPQIVWTKPDHVTNKKGSIGAGLKVMVNYFELHAKRAFILSQYHVSFDPEEDRTFFKKKLLRQHSTHLGSNYIFDGTMLFTARKLPEPCDFTTRRPDTDEMVHIKITFIKELQSTEAQFFQVLNIIMKRCLEALELKQYGRSYFNPKDEEATNVQGIKVWPGYTTAIRQFEHSILLNVDITHKFLRTETVLEVINNHLRRMGNRSNAQAITTQELLGSVVMTSYNDKTYRVDDIAWAMNPLNTFEYKGENISYKKYYKQKYNMDIKDMNQPLVLSKPKKKDLRGGMVGNIMLVPELCTMTGLSDQMRNNFTIMKELANILKMNPDKRVNALKEFNSKMFQCNEVQQELQKWGLDLAPDLVTIPTHCLPVESIYLGKGKAAKSADDHLALQSGADWGSVMRGKSLIAPQELRNWAVVYPTNIKSNVDQLLRNLREVCIPMGMKLAQPKFIQMGGDRTQDYINSTNQCKGMQIVLLVLPNNNSNQYSNIKKHLSVQIQIPSQCVVNRTISNPRRLKSIATKIGIQINCKLGGEPWLVRFPRADLMVIGYDVYHDSLTKTDSFGACVSSYNHTLTSYLGQVRRHRGFQELSTNFTALVRNSLSHYIKVNGQPPKYIFVYRDGVGEGQIEHVKNTEIAALKQSLKMENPNDTPKLIFIIVSKRINTRVFQQVTQRENGVERVQILNPSPGTVVDDVITQPERYDFFLVSQCVNEGTVAPTSYNIIEDDLRLPVDKIQQVSFKLTHLYFNWQGTVRVPAPCLYAHKLAYITGTAIHEEASPLIANKLWYL